MNWIFFIEKSIEEWLSLNKEPTAEEVKEVGKALGAPSKKKDYVLSRYNDVFRNLIQKRCVDIEDNIRECIYSWNPRTYIRYFPAALHATGTVLLFKDPGNVELVSYPIPRAMDLGGHGVSIPSDRPDEVTQRIDGWQINFYYDPLLKKWIPSTKYVLHNMYYEHRKLIIEEFGKIVNPYCLTAYRIAETSGLLNKLKGYEGWTFTFVLKGPEPAITKPLPPDPENYEMYELYLIMARKPDGTLLTVRESSKLLNYPTIPIIDITSMEELISKYSKSVDIRSVFARFNTDPETPVIIEVKSSIYPDAMNIKYFSDPKSLLILASEGLGDVALNLIYEGLRDYAKRVIKAYENINKLISLNLNNTELDNIFMKIGLRKFLGELRGARKRNNPKRLVKKLTCSLAEGKTPQEAAEILENLAKNLEQCLQSM